MNRSNFYPEIIKPLLDFVFSLFLLVALSWLILFILLVYCLTFQFPFLYRAQRMGKNAVPFVMYKFRTLQIDESRSAADRKFWWGSVLRTLNLDELPQLWNVLKGKMSFIGPRPLPIEYDSLFSEEQRKRFKVKPGITGWAQVNGRHSIPWKKKLELDNYYVDHISARMDGNIIIKTVVLLLSFKKDRSLEEEKFTGAN